MKEYIERAPVLDAVKCTSGDYMAAWSEIAHMQAADVVPVVHGEWSFDTGIATCSKCGCGFNLLPVFTHYCPNCGAKMDGGAHETD